MAAFNKGELLAYSVGLSELEVPPANRPFRPFALPLFAKPWRPAF